MRRPAQSSAERDGGGSSFQAGRILKRHEVLVVGGLRDWLPARPGAQPHPRDWFRCGASVRRGTAIECVQLNRLLCWLQREHVPEQRRRRDGLRGPSIPLSAFDLTVPLPFHCLSFLFRRARTLPPEANRSSSSSCQTMRTDTKTVGLIWSTSASTQWSMVAPIQPRPTTTPLRMSTACGSTATTTATGTRRVWARTVQFGTPAAMLLPPPADDDNDDGGRLWEC